MKAFEGFRSEAAGAKMEQLAPGGYVARIAGVRITGEEPDQTLVLRVDVAEGPQTGYFTKRYRLDSDAAGNRYAVRYKGDYHLRIPNPDNKRAKYPESDKKRFNDAIFRIEKSNPGYQWNWDEQSLAGKLVGINMREGTFNGRPYTMIGRLEIVDDVRSGRVQPMTPRQPSWSDDFRREEEAGSSRSGKDPGESRTENGTGNNRPGNVPGFAETSPTENPQGFVPADDTEVPFF